LNYYKRANWTERWKLWLAAIAVIATVGWLGGGLLLGRRSDERFSHGELASKHQHLDTDCTACHVPFSPISRSAWPARLFTAPADHPEPFQVLPADANCQACHPFNSLGGIHHANQKAELVTSCGSCHRDHRGRDANLSRVADSDCTSCHRELQANSTGPSHFTDRRTSADLVANSIRGFADPNDGHPNFRALNRPDPGLIRFNHKLHLTSGIIYLPGARKMTLGDIKDLDEKAYERYRKMQSKESVANESTVVQLSCEACHEPGQRGFQTWRPTKASGAYMQPIRYEEHCQTCHPLRFDDNLKLKDATVPHRLQPQQVRQFVEGYYATHADTAMALKLPAVPLPGKHPPTVSDIPTAQARAQLALRNLFVGKKVCGECHEYDHMPNAGTALPGEIITAVKEKRDQWQDTTTMIPEVWLPHAKFSHSSHRNYSDGTRIECAKCHSAAQSESHKDVLLPGIEACRECHAPASAISAGRGGSSRFDCVECHNFHHADDPAGRPATITKSSTD
jgi:hypothetical protein